MAPVNTLITGVNGFAGSYLAEHLLSQGISVHGTVRPGSAVADPLKAAVTLHEVDLMDAPSVARAVSEVAPDLIFHLAALSSVSGSWADPADTLTNNICCQLNVLQSVLAADLDPRILIVGSKEEYGMLHPDELPVAEDNPLRPTSPYGVSKVAQDLMGYQFFLSHGLRCVRVRPFNHIGPRQGDEFVVPAIARQVAEAEAGLHPPLVHVGNLEVKRDFTDVRDVVRAYHLILLHGEPGEVYNIGSGAMVSLGYIIEFLLERASVTLSVEQDQARLRPGDVAECVCDYSRLQRQTGWRPQIPLQQTLEDTLHYWREKVKG